MFVADGVEYSVSAYVWNHLRKDDQADSTSVAVDGKTKVKLLSPNNLEHKPGPKNSVYRLGRSTLVLRFAAESGVQVVVTFRAGFLKNAT